MWKISKNHKNKIDFLGLSYFFYQRDTYNTKNYIKFRSYLATKVSLYIVILKISKI